MATIRWYLVNGVDANGWQQLSTSAQTAATCNAGWVVGTGATFSSELQSNAERSAGFTANTVPDGTLDLTLKDAFCTPLLSGTFAAANWTFQFAVVSTVQAGAADGQIVFRLLKANADGSNATLLTAAQQSASVCTNVGATDINGTLTFNPGAITLANQYLFVQIAWKRTGAGGMTTTNIRLRTGSSTTVGTTILSSDFTIDPTSYLTGTTIASTAQVFKPRVAGAIALRQILFGLSQSMSNVNIYNGVMGGPGPWVPAETTAQVPWPCTGTFRNFVGEISAAVGVSAATITLRINGVNTALTVTITGTGVVVSDVSTPDVLVNEGDLVSLGYSIAGSIGTISFRWALEFESVTPKESVYGSPVGLSANTTLKQTGAFAFHQWTMQGTAHYPPQVCAVAGTITKFYVRATANPGAGAGMTWYFNKNGVRQDGTGGTVDTAVSVINTTQANSVFALPVSPGDILLVEGVSVGTFAAMNWAVSHNLVADTHQQSMVGGATANVSAGTQSTPLVTKNVAPVSNETNFASRAMAHSTIPVTLTGMQVSCSAAPGVGHFRSAALRSGAVRASPGTNAGPIVTFLDTEQLKSDLTTSYTTTLAPLPALPDLLNVHYEEDGTAANTYLSYAFIQINPWPEGLTQEGTFLASTAVVNPGTASAVGGATSVTGTTLSSTAVVTPGTAAPGAVTLTGATRATTATLSLGTVSGGAAGSPQTVEGAIISADVDLLLQEDGFHLLLEDGGQLLLDAVPIGIAVTFPGSVAYAALTLTGTHRASTLSVNPGTVTTTTSVLGAHRPTTELIRAGNVSALIGGAHRPSTASLFPGAITLTVLGAHLPSTTQLFPGRLSPVGAFLPSGSTTFPGSALQEGGLGGATIPSTATLFPGSVTTGAVTLVGTTLGSTLQLFVGTITTTTAVFGATRPSTATLFTGHLITLNTAGATLLSTATLSPGSISTGAVPITGATLASTAVVRAGAVTTTTAVLGASIPSSATIFPGRVSALISGATLASTAVTFPGTVAYTITGAFRPSTATLFPGSLAPVGAFIPSGSTVFPGTVVPQGVLAGAHVPSTVSLFPGSVTTGAVTITGTTRPSSATLYPGTVLAASAVSGATVPATSTVFPGSVTTLTAVAGATLGSTAQVFPGIVGTLTAIAGATVPSTAIVFPGSVTTLTSVAGATLLSTAQLFPGKAVVAAQVLGAHLPSTATLFPGTITTLTFVGGAFVPSTVQLFPGSVRGAPRALACPVDFSIDTDVLPRRRKKVA